MPNTVLFVIRFVVHLHGQSPIPSTYLYLKRDNIFEPTKQKSYPLKQRHFKVGRPNGFHNI